ncbi:MAG: tetratricopeptide repeat protein [Polyangiaceae bacterium]
MKRSLLAAAALSAALLSTSIALATGEDPGGAEELFNQARALKEQGKLVEACVKFNESYRLDPAPGTLLNIAECNRVDGKTATAWSQFLEAARAFRRKNDTQRALFAEAEAQKLEGLRAFVVIHVTAAPDGLVLHRDDAALTTASVGTPLPIDPGEHVILAEAPGRLPQRVTFKVDPQQSVEVTVPALELAPVVAAPDDGEGDTQRIAGFVVGGVGLAALIAGFAFVGLTASQAGEVDRLCPNHLCSTSEGRDALDTANLYANLANGFVAGGGALVGTGLIVVLAAPGTFGSSPSGSATRVELHLSGRF